MFWESSGSGRPGGRKRFKTIGLLGPSQRVFVGTLSQFWEICECIGRKSWEGPKQTNYKFQTAVRFPMNTLNQMFCDFSSHPASLSLKTFKTFGLLGLLGSSQRFRPTGLVLFGRFQYSGLIHTWMLRGCQNTQSDKSLEVITVLAIDWEHGHWLIISYHW